MPTRMALVAILAMANCAGHVDAAPDLDAGGDASPKSYAPYSCHDGAVLRPDGADCTCADGSGSVCADGACAC